MTRQEQKAAAFRALHAAEPFVIPRPWDAGSARILETLGLRALATTSSGFAFTLGRRDDEATLDEVVEHTAALDRATMIPLSVDLENGHGAAAVDAAHALPYPFMLTAELKATSAAIEISATRLPASAQRVADDVSARRAVLGSRSGASDHRGARQLMNLSVVCLLLWRTT